LSYFNISGSYKALPC